MQNQQIHKLQGDELMENMNMYMESGSDGLQQQNSKENCAAFLIRRTEFGIDSSTAN